MDVASANLYHDAYKNFKNANETLTMLQHLMFGVNAHINLDVGIATSATMKGKN